MKCRILWSVELVPEKGSAQRNPQRTSALSRTTFNGIGLILYGKRCEWPDGSYVTTEWFCFFWVPLIPQRSMRIRNVRRSWLYPVAGSRHYEILHDDWSIDRRQVVYVYLYLVAWVLALIVGTYWKEMAGAAFSAILLYLPHYVRYFAGLLTKPKGD